MWHDFEARVTGIYAGGIARSAVVHRLRIISHLALSVFTFLTEKKHANRDSADVPPTLAAPVVVDEATAGGRLAASRSEAINDSLTPPTTEFSNERISSSRTSQNVGEKRGMIPPPRFNPCAYATEFPPGWRTVQLHSHVRARTREVNEVTRRWRDARDSFTRCIALRERQTKSPGYSFPRWNSNAMRETEISR